MQTGNNALSKEADQYVAQAQELQQQFLVHNQLTGDMRAELGEAQMEKKAKHKFLAAAMIFSHMEAKKANADRLTTAWHTWINQVICYKMVETAFNKVLELNHKHSAARCQAGATLLRHVFSQARLGRKALGYRAIKHIGMMCH